MGAKYTFWFDNVDQLPVINYRTLTEIKSHAVVIRCMDTCWELLRDSEHVVDRTSDIAVYVRWAIERARARGTLEFPIHVTLHQDGSSQGNLLIWTIGVHYASGSAYWTKMLESPQIPLWITRLHSMAPRATAENEPGWDEAPVVPLPQTIPKQYGTW